MPVWHQATADWVKKGKLVLLGVTQEQHADRCRLFSQWKQFDWPILHDPINVLDLLGVPVVVENMPGAGAIVGTVAAAKAPPDGYTVAVAVASSFSVSHRPTKRRNRPRDKDPSARGR